VDLVVVRAVRALPMFPEPEQPMKETTEVTPVRQ
jgi:hypothetical protein